MTKRKSPGYGTASRLAVTASAQTISNDNWENSPTLIITNIGTDWVYINIGATATTTNGYPIPPNTQEVISKDKAATSLSVIGSGTASTIHVMASGEGV